MTLYVEVAIAVEEEVVVEEEETIRAHKRIFRDVSRSGT